MFKYGDLRHMFDWALRHLADLLILLCIPSSKGVPAHSTVFRCCDWCARHTNASAFLDPDKGIQVILPVIGIPAMHGIPANQFARNIAPVQALSILNLVHMLGLHETRLDWCQIKGATLVSSYIEEGKFHPRLHYRAARSTRMFSAITGNNCIR